jgi:hypothetical protein
MMTWVDEINALINSDADKIVAALERKENADLRRIFLKDFGKASVVFLGETLEGEQGKRWREIENQTHNTHSGRTFREVLYVAQVSLLRRYRPLKYLYLLMRSKWFWEELSKGAWRGCIAVLAFILLCLAPVPPTPVSYERWAGGNCWLVDGQWLDCLPPTTWDGGGKLTWQVEGDGANITITTPNTAEGDALQAEAVRAIIEAAVEAQDE